MLLRQSSVHPAALRLRRKSQLRKRRLVKTARCEGSLAEDPNPYQSPREVASVVTRQTSSRPALDRVALILWPIVFGLNLILPLWFGWRTTSDHARWGLYS